MDTPEQPVTAVSYRRVSTDEQAASGLGLDAQAAAITAECDRRGWDLHSNHTETISGATSIRIGPAFAAAVEAVRRARGVLVVAKADRCSRSVLDFVQLLDRSEREGWRVLALDLPQVDTTTATGRFVAVTMANAAELERRLIGERTRAALQAKKARGARLGRPRLLPDDVLDRVVAERDAGRTWKTITDALNADGIPTARGAPQWRISATQGAYRSRALDDAAAASAHATRP